MVRTEVAVGIARLASMFRAIRAGAPESGSAPGGGSGTAALGTGGGIAAPSALAGGGPGEAAEGR